ncbi:MAG TPA: PDZ domain-containing protein [Vicinamibacterales bacterium]|nr:PDZ domain-containing protein [Vicinamibacterales bacterium]
MHVRSRSIVVILCLLWASRAAGQDAIAYTVSFPAPEHHWAQVEIVLSQLPARTLELRMSRSSPGRYALHEFSKNVFDVHAHDGRGRELSTGRPNPYQWDVAGHDGTVRVTYKVYGDHVDGTYLGIDTTHAHMNMPATLMWARGLEMRPVRVTFAPPPGSKWIPATQLFPTDDPWTFTAPNLQYLLDSPTELSAQTIRSFVVRNRDGRTFTIRAAVHHDADAAAVDEYVAAVEQIVHETGAVFGEFPEFDPGTYTFLADYLPWGGGDGMEHRNSTVVAAPISLRDRGARRRVLTTVAHEFFHAWNVERIRPQSLEPFDYEQANMSGELWLAEGFTQYYGTILMHRAGLMSLQQAISSLTGAINAVVHHPGRQFRSAVEMSRMAPFTDAARSVDRTNFSTTFISYYTYGNAIALALDLTLRDRSNGGTTLDDYMRALWQVHGKPAPATPGFVARPYTLADARERLAEVAGDRAFADEFFAKYIEGREAADYARLLARAGILLQQRRSGAAWMGDLDLTDSLRVDSVAPWGSPAYVAGLDEGDVLTSMDGKTVSTLEQWRAALAARKPGERVVVGYRRRDGATGTTTVTLAQDPAFEAVPIETSGGTLTSEQNKFRQEWLGSKTAKSM